jgi:hypothetical protein
VLLSRIDVGVAIGWRVDDDLQPFGPGRRAVRPAIECADISGRGRRRTASPYVPELAGIIGREKDIMMCEGKAADSASGQPDQCRQRARLLRHWPHGAPRCYAQQPGGKRGGIAIEHYAPSGQMFAIGQGNAHDLAPVHGDLRRCDAIAKDDAELTGQALQRLGQCAHSAVNCPHALCFDMGDQHQRRRGRKGGGAAISGITPEQLPQPVIREIGAQRRPQRAIGPERQPIRKAAPAHPPAKRQWISFCVTQKGPVERIMEAPCLCRKSAKPRDGFCPRKAPDCITARLEISMQIEPLVFVPRMPRKKMRLADAQMILQPRTRRCKNRIKHRSQSENGRPRINHRAADIQLPYLAACTRRLFNHGHRFTARGQQQRTGQPADSGADDNGLAFLHQALLHFHI